MEEVVHASDVGRIAFEMKVNVQFYNMIREISYEVDATTIRSGAVVQ